MSAPNFICGATGVSLLAMLLWCYSGFVNARRKSSTWHNSAAITKRDANAFSHGGTGRAASGLDAAAASTPRPSPAAARVMLTNILTRLNRPQP